MSRVYIRFGGSTGLLFGPYQSIKCSREAIVCFGEFPHYARFPVTDDGLICYDTRYYDVWEIWSADEEAAANPSFPKTTKYCEDLARWE